MNSQQVQDILLMYEAVYNEELREKAETVKSSGGAGGQVTVDKPYPATLGGKKGVKSTDSQGTEYFMPYQSQGGLSKPNTLPDLNKAQYKNTYTNRYQNIPSNQGAANPQSHLSRTGVPRVNARTAAYGIPEQVDLFDYLLEYLVSEGYADTNQDALVIMANLNQDQINDILTERRREEKGEPRKPRDPAFETVAKSMGSSRMGVQPRGQKKVPGKKPPAAGEYGAPRSPAQKVAMRRAAAERSQEMQSSRFD